ncbi:hypothetical protein Acr_13g0006520 [Actinidia rufa]|uniref:Uncharacterized protein n=1 Tax=Actinidia rufa TaxID=165716 RepID=A0A7J0FKM2_9ERIC|nr:hypothetical protein Acr_13g0006520 [Actinidia rufa]
MVDGRSMTLTEWRNSQSFQEKQGDAVGKEGWRAIPIGGECLDRGATVRHGSSGISKESGQGKQPLHRGTQSKRRVAVISPVVCTREERWSYDNSQSDVLCGAPRWRVWGTPVGGVGHLVFGGAGSETIKKDNLKTSDYLSSGQEREIVESNPSG